MKQSIFLCTIFTALTFFAISSVTLAQTEEAPNTTNEDLVTSASVVADINIYDIDVTKDEAGVIAGNFTMTAGMGQQNNIAYGVMVVNETGDLVFADRAGVIPSLKQGQVEKLSFSSSLPPNLSGNLSVVLVAENETGLLLSYRELVKKTFSPSSTDLSCLRDKEKTDTLSCKNKTATDLTVAYSSSMLGERTVFEVRPVTESEVMSFSPLTKPGRYFVAITNENNEQAIVQLSKEGAYGQIKNIAIYQKTDNITEAVIPIYGSGLKDSSLSLTLTNNDGTVCDEQTQAMTLPVYTLTINPSCLEGTVQATLKNASGETLDSKSQPFSIQTVVTNSSVNENSSTTAPTVTKETPPSDNFVLVLVIFLIVVVIIFFLLKRRQVPPPLALLLFVVGFSLLPLRQTEAVSLFDSRYSQDRGDFAWLMSVVIDFGTTGPFYPGQVTTLTAGGFVQSDNGASVGATGNGSALYSPKSDMDPNFSFDGAPAGYGNAIASINNVPADKDTHHFSGSIPFTVPSGMSVGDHFLTFVKAQVSGGCYKDPNFGKNCVDISPSATLPFKVANKPASVDIKFVE